jgi:NADPH-dependent ferric siderophore reductase
VGDRVALWGPRSSFAPPPDGPLLVVGDETALPAIAAILDQHAAKRPIQVVIETADPAQVIDLPSGPDVALCWVFRGGRSAGTSGHLLATIRDLQLHPDLAYAFGAGETREIGAIRQHLRRERGLAAERVRMVGYWKRTSATAG